ncbi:DUF1367 family protein [Phreatobacter sp. HK31-P]
MAKAARKRDPEDPPIMMRVGLGPRLEPSTPFDQERLAGYGFGREVQVWIWQSRSAPHLNLYWACLGSAVRNSSDWMNVKQLHKAIKVGLGYVERIRLLDGTEIKEPASIALDRMDQAEFKQFFDAAIDLICREIFKGMRTDTFIRAVKEEMGMKRNAA